MKNQPSEEALAALSALQTAVSNALERKQKLGQYAVIWKNDKVVLQHFPAISQSTTAIPHEHSN
jgi:hypothetical protein